MIIETSLGQLILYTYVVVMFVMLGHNRIVLRDMDPKPDCKDSVTFLKALPFLWPFMMMFFVLRTIPHHLYTVCRKGFRK